MKNNFCKLLCLFVSILSINFSLAQVENKWSQEMILWRCKTDSTMTIIYRVNIGSGGINSLIEIIGPNKMDSTEIQGTLKVQEVHHDGNFNTIITKSEEIKIKQSYFSQQYNFDFSNLNQISFEGNCFDNKKLEKSFQKTKEIIKKNTNENKVKVKTKTAPGGVRG